LAEAVRVEADAHYGVAAECLGVLDHSEQGTAPGLVDGLRELGDLAGGEGAEPAGEAPPEAEADDDQPPAQAEVLLELQARDLERVRRVQRKPLVIEGTGRDGH